jgi:hypothetical protein
MRVHVANSYFSQAQANANSLVEPKKIGASAPFVESNDNVFG